MTGSRLLVGVASVLAGTTVLLVVFGFAYNPLLLVAAAPFGASTYLLWSHATGRLEARMRERARSRPTDGGPFGGSDRPGPNRRADRSRRPSDAAAERPPSARAAAQVLGVAPDADDATIRAAFRERAKALHPDAPGGDEVSFRRVRDAYERLTDRQ